jgi:hypothetical protein
LSIAVTAGGVSNADPVGELSGSVTYNGRKLTYGTVLFFGVDRGKNDCALARGLIVDGKYKVNHVPVGPVKIVVLSHPKVPVGISNPPGNKKPHSPRQDNVPIPDKYGHTATTDLTYSVKKGSQTHDIDLPR